MVERQPCKLKVPGSIPGGGFYYRRILFGKNTETRRGLDAVTLWPSG